MFLVFLEVSFIRLTCSLRSAVDELLEPANPAGAVKALSARLPLSLRLTFVCFMGCTS